MNPDKSAWVFDRKASWKFVRSDNLEKLLNSFSETSVYVIEEQSHRLLYFNERCRQTSRGKAAIGTKCNEVWPEVCANCPIVAMGEGSSSHIVCHDPLQKTAVDVTANRILWDDCIPAVVVTAAPHRFNYEEEQGARRIREMYANSLITVFGECIIVNLTTDYYVNCQQDSLWSDIPERGEFGVENRRYSAKTVHPEDLELFEEHFSREALLRLFSEGKKQISMRLRRLIDDKTYHMVEFTAARIEHLSEQDCWCVLVFRDVQDEYLLEQRRTLEISQLAIAAQTAYQMVISVNLSMNTYHILTYERYPVKKPESEGSFDDLIATELLSVAPEYRQEFQRRFTRENLTAAFGNGQHVVTMEVPHIGEDGVYHWHFTQVVQVKNPTTDDLIEITLSRNIDAERRLREEAVEKERGAKLLLEEALRKAERASHAKSDFLSRMSHDIRTPMNAIIGMTELAQLHLEDSSRIADYLQKIEQASAHLLGLINEVLDVSKIESGTVELMEKEFDLHRLLQDAAALVQIQTQAKRQSLSFEIPDDLHTQVSGDEQRLRQVLVNILDNASKYTPDLGRITVSVEELKKEEASIGTYRITIEDNGIGMTEEYLEHLFEPFSRAQDPRLGKVTGTGLGMTVVRNIVSLMGGDLRVESEYGKGSRFILTLFLPKRNASSPAVTSSEEQPMDESFDHLRVLLVEDNEINQQIAADMLGFLGAKVEIAGNGQEAVSAVRNNPIYYYDLVFMDIQMPVMDGYEAARQIRELNLPHIGELPIVAMTADAFAEDEKQARLAGMDGHLAKPISIDQLRTALSRCAWWKQKNHPDAFRSREDDPPVV